MDWFLIFWLTAVGSVVVWNGLWAWRALKTGIATYYFHYQLLRSEKPFEFKMMVALRIFGAVVALGMFVFALVSFGGV